MWSCLKQGIYTKMTFKMSFQPHYSPGLSKHCLWRKIKHGWVFKWRKQQWSSYWLCLVAKGKLDLYLHLLQLSFISSGYAGDVSDIKFTLRNKNMMASPLLLCRNLHILFKLVVVLDTSLLGKIPNFTSSLSGHFSLRDTSEKRGSKYTWNLTQTPVVFPKHFPRYQITRPNFVLFLVFHLDTESNLFSWMFLIIQDAVWMPSLQRSFPTTPT